MNQQYLPPRQGWAGQVFDSLFILALVYVSLLAPLLLNQANEAAAEAIVSQANEAQANSAMPHPTQQTPSPPTWESLQQNPVMQAQWIKLGYDETKAATLINHRFDYSIDPLSLVVTAAVIIAYFVFLIAISRRQYQQVINEKFGEI